MTSLTRHAERGMRSCDVVYKAQGTGRETERDRAEGGACPGPRWSISRLAHDSCTANGVCRTYSHTSDAKRIERLCECRPCVCLVVESQRMSGWPLPPSHVPGLGSVTSDVRYVRYSTPLIGPLALRSVGILWGPPPPCFCQCRVYSHTSLRGLKLRLVHLAVGDSC